MNKKVGEGLIFQKLSSLKSNKTSEKIEVTIVKHSRIICKQFSYLEILAKNFRLLRSYFPTASSNSLLGSKHRRSCELFPFRT